MTYRLSELPDDGLATTEVGGWAERKYKLLGIYAELFSTGMKDKWDARIYIDLFAGCGRARIRGTNRILPASPTIAMSVANPFDRYVFCEKDGELAEVLHTRAQRDFPALDVRVCVGDANDLIGDVLSRLRAYRKSFKVLSFCFVDPCGTRDLAFETVRALAKYFVDFLILIPTGMDASRNWARQFQIDGEDTALDRFLGTREWREARTVQSGRLGTFDAFLTRFFSDRMKSLGYDYGGIDSSELIRNPERQQRLYRLGFFSKHPLGGDFWNKARKYSTSQLGLF